MQWTCLGWLQESTMHLCRTRFNEGLNNDEDYLKSALDQIRLLERYHSFTSGTRLLDFGCGQGRLANGLIADGAEIGHYCGIDTNSDAVNWCRQWIQKEHPKYQFIHVPAYNERYNQHGKPQMPLPIRARSFAITFLNSVFSHMLTSDVKFYLSQMFRVLCDGGVLYLTAFLEKDVPKVEENPVGYLNKIPSGPLHRVRYEEGFFLSMVERAGFGILDYQHQGIARTQQSVVVAEKPNMTGPL